MFNNLNLWKYNILRKYFIINNFNKEKWVAVEAKNKWVHHQLHSQQWSLKSQISRSSLITSLRIWRHLTSWLPLQTLEVRCSYRCRNRASLGPKRTLSKAKSQRWTRRLSSTEATMFCQTLEIRRMIKSAWTFTFWLRVSRIRIWLARSRSSMTNIRCPLVHWRIWKKQQSRNHRRKEERSWLEKASRPRL